MSTLWPSPIPFLRALLLGAFLIAAIISRGAECGFSATLSADQKNTAGLTSLTPAESEALDQMIAAEVAQARTDNSIELVGTFVSRRSDAERKQAGLDRLTPAQLTKLNGLIATVVAANPKPKERPRIKDSDVFSQVKKPEVHGEFSLTYGRTSGGGEFRGASMWVDYFDPKSGLELSFGYSRSSGKGLYGFDPYDYGDGYGYGNGTGYGYGAGVGLYTPTLSIFGSQNWYQGNGPIYGNSIANDWNNAGYYRGFRRQ
jgi:hypothetical protein